MIIKIKEEFRLPGTNILIEANDFIKIEEVSESGWEVILTGGSIGDFPRPRKASDLQGSSFNGDSKELFSSKDEADKKAKRMNGYLSPGEKKYYRLKYIPVEVENGKYTGK